MDRHDIGASGWKAGLLPESASSNHWHPKRDADIEEMQGNGWGPGAGRKAFGSHWDRAAEMANGVLQGRRSNVLGRQALCTKDSRVSSRAGETLWLREQHLKKEGLKYRFSISPALKDSSASLFLPTALPAWLWHGTAGTNPCHHQRNSKFPCSFTKSGWKLLSVYWVTKGSPLEGWFHIGAVGSGLSRGSVREEARECRE